MALSEKQKQYVVRSVLRILRDVNRDEIIAALKQDLLVSEKDDTEEQLQLDSVVLAVAEACRERLAQPPCSPSPSTHRAFYGCGPVWRQPRPWRRSPWPA
jgi:hypothetical protein